METVHRQGAASNRGGGDNFRQEDQIMVDWRVLKAQMADAHRRHETRMADLDKRYAAEKSNLEASLREELDVLNLKVEELFSARMRAQEDVPISKPSDLQMKDPASADMEKHASRCQGNLTGPDEGAAAEEPAPETPGGSPRPAIKARDGWGVRGGHDDDEQFNQKAAASKRDSSPDAHPHGVKRKIAPSQLSSPDPKVKKKVAPGRPSFPLALKAGKVEHTVRGLDTTPAGHLASSTRLFAGSHAASSLPSGPSGRDNAADLLNPADYSVPSSISGIICAEERLHVTEAARTAGRDKGAAEGQDVIHHTPGCNPSTSSDGERKCPSKPNSAGLPLGSIRVKAEPMDSSGLSGAASMSREGGGKSPGPSSRADVDGLGKPEGPRLHGAPAGKEAGIGPLPVQEPNGLSSSRPCDRGSVDSGHHAPIHCTSGPTALNSGAIAESMQGAERETDVSKLAPLDAELEGPGMPQGAVLRLCLSESGSDYSSADADSSTSSDLDSLYRHEFGSSGLTSSLEDCSPRKPRNLPKSGDMQADSAHPGRQRMRAETQAGQGSGDGLAYGVEPQSRGQKDLQTGDGAGTFSQTGEKRSRTGHISVVCQLAGLRKARALDLCMSPWHQFTLASAANSKITVSHEPSSPGPPTPGLQQCIPDFSNTPSPGDRHPGVGGTPGDLPTIIGRLSSMMDDLASPREASMQLRPGDWPSSVPAEKGNGDREAASVPAGRQRMGAKRRFAPRDRELLACKKPRRRKSREVERKRKLPTSGFKGVSLDRGWYYAYITAQGKKMHLGKFRDAGSAARRYDEEALKLHGAKAVLNFQSGYMSNHTSTGGDNQSPVLPLAGDCGREGPATNGSLPAGNVDADLGPVPATKGRLTSSLIANTPCTPTECKPRTNMVPVPGPEVASQLQTVEVKLPDGQVQYLGLLIDATQTAWFSILQVSMLLLGGKVNYATLYRHCKREGVHRSATREEEKLLEQGKMVESPGGLVLATADSVRKALLSMGVPARTAKCLCDKRATPLVKPKEEAEGRKAEEVAAHARCAARGNFRFEGSVGGTGAGNNHPGEPTHMRDTPVYAGPINGPPSTQVEERLPRSSGNAGLARNRSEVPAAGPVEGGSGRLGSSAGLRTAHSGGISGETLPIMHPHWKVTKEILAPLKPLRRHQLETLLGNWYQGVKGKYNIPTFAFQKLNLFRVFWAVVKRKGFDAVEQNKQWTDVWRALDIDLTGQTNKTYAMRNHYKKCLLHFEAYLTSGQYAAELAQGRDPSSEHSVLYTPSCKTEAVVAHVNAALEARETQVPAAATSQGTPARGAQATAAGVTRVSTAGKTHVTAAGKTHVTAAGETHVTAAGKTHVTAAGKTHVTAAGKAHVTAAGATRVSAAGSIQAAEVCQTRDMAVRVTGDGSKPVSTPRSAKTGEGWTVGQRMGALGPRLVGKMVKVFWLGQEWRDVTVTHYSEDLETHFMRPETGKTEELCEVLKNLTDREIMVHPKFPLDQLEALDGVRHPPAVLPPQPAPLPAALPRQLLPRPPARPVSAGTGTCSAPLAPNQEVGMATSSKFAMQYNPAHKEEGAAVYASAVCAAGGLEVTTARGIWGPEDRDWGDGSGLDASPIGPKRGEKRTVGPRMAALGPHLVGIKVKLHFFVGAWKDAIVVKYNKTLKMHRLLYDQGMAEEHCEEEDLFNLKDSDIKEHPDFPLDQLEVLAGVAQSSGVPPPPPAPLPDAPPRLPLALPPARPAVAGTGPAPLAPSQCSNIGWGVPTPSPRSACAVCTAAGNAVRLHKHGSRE